MTTFDPKQLLSTLRSHPGVYEFYDKNHQVLYVGKAKDLRKRLQQYFNKQPKSLKTQIVIQQLADVSVTITRTENEALLLESNLIKKLKPRYNILLRDDKSYPYIFLSAHSEYPRLDLHRGPKTAKGIYFGPYPSALAVRETLNLLQKLFKIRQCSDNFFALRTRPCLQYQINRCTAPCVGYITPEDYQRNVELVRLFLSGKSHEIEKILKQQMKDCASALKFEAAAIIRDQLKSLEHIQEKQYVATQRGEVDVIVVKSEQTYVCVLVMFIRHGRVLGSKPFFPKLSTQTSDEEVLETFLPQYYLHANHKSDVPKRIITNIDLTNKTWLEAALSEAFNYKIEIAYHVKGQYRYWLKMAEINAKHTLAMQISDRLHFHQKLKAFQVYFKLPNFPQRIECFDVSHMFGEATIAACVVFNAEGPLKEEYRRFNITDVAPGDDYGALKQALLRHYTQVKSKTGILPDVLIIDGGKGQLSQATAVLEEIQATHMLILGVAKGVSRKPGKETIFVAHQPEPIHFDPTSSVLHCIQQIRDEAHRFAIMGHRQRRGKTRTHSPLEGIPGVGAKRRRHLLLHFGGIQALRKATINEIAKVEGISQALAKTIHDHLQGTD